MNLNLQKSGIYLYSNIWLAKVFDALKDASSLKSDIVEGMDIIVLRELTGGIYFGEPRGIRKLPDGQREGINTEVYTTNEIVRLGKVGFEIAEQRKKKFNFFQKCSLKSRRSNGNYCSRNIYSTWRNFY